MLLLTGRTSKRIIGSYTGFLGSFSIERGPIHDTRDGGQEAQQV
jgi:hypothetical protein